MCPPLASGIRPPPTGSLMLASVWELPPLLHRARAFPRTPALLLPVASGQTWLFSSLSPLPRGPRPSPVLCLPRSFSSGCSGPHERPPPRWPHTRSALHSGRRQNFSTHIWFSHGPCVHSCFADEETSPGEVRPWPQDLRLAAGGVSMHGRSQAPPPSPLLATRTFSGSAFHLSLSPPSDAVPHVSWEFGRSLDVAETTGKLPFWGA